MEHVAKGSTPALPRRELLAAGALLLVLGAAMWGSQVWHGGFYWADDWYRARLYLFPDQNGLLFGSLNYHVLQFSPVLALALSVPFRLFGVHPAPQLALGIAIAIVTSLLLYWVLRALGMARAHAWIVAGLALLFPWSDSSRLWATGSMNNVAVILWLGGLLVALRGLGKAGRRAFALGGGAVLLFTLSALTYPVTAGALLLTGPVYAHLHGWRRALSRWPFDVVPVAAAVAYVSAHQPSNHLSHPTVEGSVDHASALAQGAGELLLRAMMPGDLVPRPVIGVLAVVVCALAGLAAVLMAQADPARATLRRWLLVAGCAVPAIAVAYAPFIPARPTYIPLASGLENRVNLLAAIPIVMLVYALVVLACTLTVRAGGGRLRMVMPLAALVGAAIAITYAGLAQRDKSDWARAWALERHVLAVIKRTLPDPPRGASIYAFGMQNYVRAGIPVFAIKGDLRNALKVQFRDPYLRALPMRLHPIPTRWVCERHDMFPVDGSYNRPDGASYQGAYFVSIRRDRAVAIRDAAQCRFWSRRFSRRAR